MMVRVAGRRLSLESAAIWTLAMAVGLIWIFPLVWMVTTSVKPEGQIMSTRIELLPRALTLEHYIAVFERPVARWFVNSVIVATGVTIGSLTVGALAGYALARMHFPGRRLIFALMIGALLVPFELTVVPLFISVLRLKLANSYVALILPPLASVFSVYLYRQFFLTLPRELEDAAAIDGCQRFQTFWRIALPLARPATVAGAILIWTTNWNAFLWPLLVALNDEMKTMPVGTAIFSTVGLQQTSERFGYGPAMAAVTILAAPTLIVFLFLQRYFIEGVRGVGLKG